MTPIYGRGEVVKETWLIAPLTGHPLPSLRRVCRTYVSHPGVYLLPSGCWGSNVGLSVEQIRGYHRPFRSGPHRSFLVCFRWNPARTLLTGCRGMSLSSRSPKLFSEVPWVATVIHKEAVGYFNFLEENKYSAFVSYPVSSWLQVVPSFSINSLHDFQMMS